MKLIESLNKSDEFYKEMKQFLIQKKLDYKFNRIISLINIFSSEITLYYIHPYLQNSFFKRNINILKFIFNSYLKNIKNKKYFFANFEHQKIEKNNYNVLLCFSTYISKDSLFDLIDPLLENKNENILILYDIISSSKEEILNLINNQNSRIVILPIQYFFDNQKINEYQAEITYINCLFKNNYPRDIKSKKFNILINIYLKSLFKTNIGYYFSGFEIFKQFNVSNILSSDTNDFRSKLIIEIAKTNHINTIEIQYGMYGNEAIEFRYFNANKIFVWGDLYKKIMINHGISSEKIFLSGPIRLEKYRKTNIDISYNSEKKIILYAPTHKKHPSIPSLVKQMNNMFIKLTNDFPNFNFFIKPHPLDNSNDFNNLPENVTIIPQSDDIRDHITKCDIFISSGSTTTIDALFLNKSVFVFNLIGWENFIEPFEDYIDCKFIKNYKDLYNNVLNQSFQLNSNFNKFIYYNDKIRCSEIIINSLN
jgi:hypothetical protein